MGALPWGPGRTFLPAAPSDDRKCKEARRVPSSTSQPGHFPLLRFLLLKNARVGAACAARATRWPLLTVVKDKRHKSSGHTRHRARPGPRTAQLWVTKHVTLGALIWGLAPSLGENRGELLSWGGHWAHVTGEAPPGTGVRAWQLLWR